MAPVEKADGREEDQPTNESKQPQSNERVPGQGNSNDGLTRRLGADVEARGLKAHEKIKEGEGNGVQERVREGSQGGSKGQQSD